MEQCAICGETLTKENAQAGCIAFEEPHCIECHTEYCWYEDEDGNICLGDAEKRELLESKTHHYREWLRIRGRA